MKNLLLSLLALGCLPFAAQVESASQLKPVETSIQDVYQPKGKSYVHLRSKRGNEGVDPTDEADEILELPVREIVLVFTEMAPDNDRKKANLERWDNLIYTYPEFFQPGTKYSNICQCNAGGNEGEFKRVQGFYVYYKGETASEPEPVAVAETRKEEPAAAKVKETQKEPQRQAAEPVASQENKTAKVSENTTVPDKNTEQKTVPVKNEPIAASKAEQDNEPEAEEEMSAEPPKIAARPAPVKKGGKTAPRKAKDAKACRPACYGYGNEDIDTWLQENIVLSKKQKRKGSKLTANLSLQLNHDGEVTKALVTGPHPDLNKQIQEAALKMSEWKAAVRNGVAVKSQVRMMIKFDNSSKGLKAENVMVIPKFPPKCTCVSDRELFGTE